MASPSLLTNKTTGNYSISSSRKRAFESTITPSSMSSSPVELNVNGGFSTAPTSPVDESEIPTKIIATSAVASTSNGHHSTLPVKVDFNFANDDGRNMPTCSRAVEVKVRNKSQTMNRVRKLLTTYFTTLLL